MIVFLGTLTYAVIEGPSAGWASPGILALFAVAAASLVTFVLAERRHPEPLLDPRFFRSPPFTGASVIAVLAFLVMAGFRLAVACGSLIALTGWITTSVKAREIAQVVSEVR